MDVGERYFLIYELPMLAVHISLMLFLVYQRCKKGKFDTAFFTLFIAQGCARYLGYMAYVPYRFDRKVLAWRTAPFHFALVFIFVGDSAIAFNRFTAIRFPLRHNKIWSAGTLVAVLFGGVTFAFTSAALYWFLPLLLPREAYRVHSIIAAVTSATTFLVNISLESYTVVYFGMLNSTQKSTRRGELRLLLYALITEMTQLSVATYFVCNVAGCTATWFHAAMRTYMDCFRYLTWFSTAPLLLISSQSVRDEYLKFYRLKRAKVDDIAGTT